MVNEQTSDEWTNEWIMKWEVQLRWTSRYLSPDNIGLLLK